MTTPTTTQAAALVALHDAGGTALVSELGVRRATGDVIERHEWVTATDNGTQRRWEITAAGRAAIGVAAPPDTADEEEEPLPVALAYPRGMMTDTRGRTGRVLKILSGGSSVILGSRGRRWHALAGALTAA